VIAVMWCAAVVLLVAVVIIAALARLIARYIRYALAS
jgi:hypothetical protein